MILVTPYYGYAKNLLLAITGRMDRHLTSLDSDGYVRFFSIKSIGQLLTAAGFEDVDVTRVGRFAPLAKAMVVTAQKPLV